MSIFDLQAAWAGGGSCRAAFLDTLLRFARRPAALDRGRYDRFAEFLKSEG